MKCLRIKNRTSSSFYFLFCTVSPCKCSVCMEWLECETHPIAGTVGQATYGTIVVEGFKERSDRFCSSWDCIGAHFFDAIPASVTMKDFFDFDESKSYTLGGGKVDLAFTYEGADTKTGGKRIRNVYVENRASSKLFLVFCTISTCRCEVCMEWTKFETMPMTEKGWTYGVLIVEGNSSKVERFCSEWDCIGNCYYDYEFPSEIGKSKLFDYDETRDYTIGGGNAYIDFNYQQNPMTTGRQSSIKKNLRTMSTIIKGVEAVSIVSDAVSDGGGIADAVGSVLEQSDCVIS